MYILLSFYKRKGRNKMEIHNEIKKICKKNYCNYWENDQCNLDPDFLTILGDNCFQSGFEESVIMPKSKIKLPEKF